jgi:hypothetical protein
MEGTPEVTGAQAAPGASGADDPTGAVKRRGQRLAIYLPRHQVTYLRRQAADQLGRPSVSRVLEELIEHARIAEAR